MKCAYCGNASGKTDSRGMCVSCGANFKRVDMEEVIHRNRTDFTNPNMPVQFAPGEEGIVIMALPILTYAIEYQQSLLRLLHPDPPD